MGVCGKKYESAGMNVFCQLAVTLGLVQVLLGCQSPQSLTHSGTGPTTAKEKTAARKEIQALNDRWGRFCISVVETKDYSRIRTEMAD